MARPAWGMPLMGGTDLQNLHAHITSLRVLSWWDCLKTKGICWLIESDPEGPPFLRKQIIFAEC